MIEHDGVLLAWSLAALPRSWAAALGFDGGDDAADTVAATRLADHRLAYLDYEGPVSNDRGEVWRCDRGEGQWLGASPARIQLELQGAAIGGCVLLTLVEGVEWELGLAQLI